MGELWGRTAAELSELYATGTSVRDVVAACIARASEVAGLNAILSINASVMEQADRLDAASHRGSLHGIPVLVKDNLDVQGEVTAAGSRVLMGMPPAAESALAVARLQAEGAVILGRTTMHEMAWGITSRHDSLPSPLNPIDPALIAGGSSGGSAAAVRAGVAPIALGTDTAGSVRIPAAFCGVVGFKGGWEWIPSTGSISLAPSYDSIGALALTVSDARLACEVMAGQAIGPLPALSGLQVGVASDPSWPKLHGAYAAAFDTSVEALRAAGADLVPASLEVPGRIVGPYELFGMLQQREALAYHRDTLGTWPARSEQYGPEVRKRLVGAQKLAEQDLSAIDPQLHRLREDLADRLGEYDVLIAPLCSAGPSTIADPDHVLIDGELVALRDTVIAFTAVANLARAAAISVPTSLHDEHGIPVPVQLIAGSKGLPALLATAEALAA